MDNLSLLLFKQYAFGEKFTKFGKLDVIHKQLACLEFIDHVIEELIEMRRELPIRKHWSQKRTANPDWNKVKEELIDALHFFLTLFLILEMNSHDIVELYTNKNKKNIKRQEEGY